MFLCRRMSTDPSVNHKVDSLTGTIPSANNVSFFSECLIQFKNGDEKAKIDIALSVQSKILSDEMRIGELCSCVVSSGLLEELCCTLSEPCSDQLFVCVTGLVGVVVSGASLPVRGRVSSLLPSLLGLITKMENGIGEAATRAIGHLCSVCLSSNEVDLILSNGVVEGLCSQCMNLITSSRRSGSCHAQTVSLLRGLDTFCTGLAEFISKEKEKQENEKQTNKSRTQNRLEGISENEEESEFSLLSRSSTALSLIETTLNEMLTELQRQKQPAELDRPGKELRKEVAGFLIEHFPHTVVPRSSKQEGVIGLDLAWERQKMEEQLQTMMREMEEKDHLRGLEREKEREEFQKKMEELNRMKESVEAEQEKNQELIEQGRKWAETDRKRQEEEERQNRYQIGAAAIQFCNHDHWRVSGDVFTRFENYDDSILSFEFGAEVVRLSLTITNGSGIGFQIGIISSAIVANALTRKFTSLKGGAGWNLHPYIRYVSQNSSHTNYGSAFLGGNVGQRVVLEADGREGKRTLKLSQDGETAPVFFTNIPVPFRFAVSIENKNDSIEIESVEIVDEPQMVGGTIPVIMDE
ncbi:hypothetical protein BLNAU_2326 [Blattamonas nauphoetae]|uniref:Uncharacterized protein n=1 Tax=Blattamonas nauphoetae TaxID=2049346 RepID=A0ABQ9YFZ5_9EUKA|nr:hypothetical protein BLNAU_2326 [Blattamonas nauphoetae]